MIHENMFVEHIHVGSNFVSLLSLVTLAFVLGVYVSFLSNWFFFGGQLNKNIPNLVNCSHLGMCSP